MFVFKNILRLSEPCPFFTGRHGFKLCNRFRHTLGNLLKRRVWTDAFFSWPVQCEELDLFQFALKRLAFSNGNKEISASGLKVLIELKKVWINVNQHVGLNHWLINAAWIGCDLLRLRLVG